MLLLLFLGIGCHRSSPRTSNGDGPLHKVARNDSTRNRTRTQQAHTRMPFTFHLATNNHGRPQETTKTRKRTAAKRGGWMSKIENGVQPGADKLRTQSVVPHDVSFPIIIHRIISPPKNETATAKADVNTRSGQSLIVYIHFNVKNGTRDRTVQNRKTRSCLACLANGIGS